MTIHPPPSHLPLSAVAALIADPTRAALLAQLLSGRAHTAGELACGAGVSPQSASNGLARLLAGGLLAREVQGRRHYYRLAAPEVAQALEALLALDGPPRSVRPPAVPPELRVARRCYDHLAGELGVALTGALLERGWLVEAGRDYALGAAGEGGFAALGLDLPALQQARRRFATRCLDWSERRPHLAGALGAALLGRLLDLGWLAPGPASAPRALRLTVVGALALERELGLRLHPARLAS